MVGNLICCWQLFQKLFRLRSFDNKTALIEGQPEMGDRRQHIQHPELYSVGGSPKNDGWFKKQRERLAYLGVLSGLVTGVSAVGKEGKGGESLTTYTTQVSEMSGGGGENKGPEDEKVGDRSYMMTLNRDGDDAGPAIDYRHKEDIV
jgi:hypothetical protein